MVSTGEAPLRACGECTACCEGWMASEAMDMRPGKACQHCTGQGCAIYAQRPQDPCRDFTCAWVHPESELPDDMRPDRCGAIIKWQSRWRMWETVTAAPVGARIPEQTLPRLVEYAKARALPLIFVEHEYADGQFGPAKQLATGPAEFIQAARNGLNRDDMWTL